MSRLFTALAAKIYGGIAIVLALALAFVWISGNAREAALEAEIHRPVTGYAPRLAAAQRQLATARANVVTLKGTIARSNAALETARAAAAARETRLAGVVADARASAADASRLANRILARPAPPPAEACAAADALILESVR